LGLFLIVVSQLGNPELIPYDLVNESMLVVDAA
jgi:hypothetical protein